MKKIIVMLTVFCVCVLTVSASSPVGVDNGGEDPNANGVSIAIGFAILIIILLRVWRIGLKTRKRLLKTEKQAYSYIPRRDRAERSCATGGLRGRAALEDMDFPAGFGGIHNMEQLEHNMALYRLYCEITENEEGWDDARR